MRTVAFPVEIELGSDFADILSVKSYDFSFGDPEHAALLPAERAPEAGLARLAADRGRRRLRDARHVLRSTRRHAANGARYDLVLAPHGRWEVTIEISFPTNDGEVSRPGAELRHRARARPRVARRPGSSACRA